MIEDILWILTIITMLVLLICSICSLISTIRRDKKDIKYLDKQIELLKNMESEDKQMLEKGKVYGYEEIKRIFDEVKVQVVLNPFDKDEESDKKLSGEVDFITKLMSIAVISTLEKKLFGKENK